MLNEKYDEQQASGHSVLTAIRSRTCVCALTLVHVKFKKYSCQHHECVELIVVSDVRLL
jgi:hypothetical protein